MEISLDEVDTSVLFVIMTTLSCMILNWVWLRPKYLERCLRKQGLVGNSYRLFFGDSKNSSMMIKQACSEPIELSDDIVPRVLPFDHHTVKHYGMYVHNKLNYLKILLQQTQIISHSIHSNKAGAALTFFQGFPESPPPPKKKKKKYIYIYTYIYNIFFC